MFGVLGLYNFARRTKSYFFLETIQVALPSVLEPSTVQYRPSENKIVFGLKVPSGDGLGLILSLK